MKGILRYLAARIYSFHLPLYRNGKNHGSVVVRLFKGKADRYGTPGPVVAIELHVKNLKDAVKSGAVWYDRESKRLHVTLFKAGPAELRRLANRLIDVADAVEKAWSLGADPKTIEELWLDAKKGRTAKRRPAREEDDLDLDLDVEAEAGASGYEEADLIE